MATEHVRHETANKSELAVNQMTTTTIEQTLREILTVMWLDGHIELTDGPDDIADVVTVGEAAIDAALDAKPDNWTLRELYADWLEKQGNPRCESQRWMVRKEFAPVCYKPYNPPWTLHDTQLINSDQWISDIGLSGVPFRGRYNTRDYPTRIAAELDLHNALVKAGEITCEEVGL